MKLKRENPTAENESGEITAEEKSQVEKKPAGISQNTLRSVWLVEAAIAMLTSVVAIITASVY